MFTVPHGTELTSLNPLIPVFLSYILSFVWANMHLLFWLSLIPFVTSWMGERRFAPWPVALYSAVLLSAAIAYFILARALISRHGEDSALADALGRDFKGRK